MDNFGLNVIELSKKTLLVDIDNIDLTDKEESPTPSSTIEFDMFEPFGYPKELHPPYRFNFRHYMQWENINSIDRNFAKFGGTIIIPVSPEKPEIIQFACDLMSDIAYGDKHDCINSPWGGNQYYSSYSNFPYPLKFADGKGQNLKYNEEINNLLHWGVIWPDTQRHSIDKKYFDQTFRRFKWKEEALQGNLRDILSSSEYQHFPLDGDDFQVLPIDEHNGHIISFGLKVGYGAIIIVPDTADLEDLVENLGIVDFNQGWRKVLNINSKFYSDPSENIFQFIPDTPTQLITEIPTKATPLSKSEDEIEIPQLSIKIVSMERNKFNLTINDIPKKRITALNLFRFLIVYVANQKELSVVFSTNDDLIIKSSDLSTEIIKPSIFSEQSNTHTVITRIVETYIPKKDEIDNYVEKDAKGHYPPHNMDEYLSCVRLHNFECTISEDINVDDIIAIYPTWEEEINFIMDYLPKHSVT